MKLVSSSVLKDIVLAAAIGLALALLLIVGHYSCFYLGFIGMVLTFICGGLCIGFIAVCLDKLE